jgi:small subunit ribosomal protein S6
MVRQYETTFIADSHLPNEQIEATITKSVQLIEKNGGKIHLVERWGKRRLAFEIAKKQYGFYVYIRFEGEGKLNQELSRSFKLDDAVLRYLTVVMPKAALKAAEEPKVQPPEKAAEGAAAPAEAAAPAPRKAAGTEEG